MMNKDHLIVNVSAAALAATGLCCLKSYAGPLAVPLQTIVEHVRVFVHPARYVIVPLWYVAVCAMLYLLGTVLPDADSPNSMIGKHIYIPLEHRTWTHTIWVVLLFFAISLKFRVVIWLCAGYFLHLFMDTFSYCGVCWMYPISKYRHYGSNGAKVKEHHWLRLYRSQSAAEYMITAVIATLAVVCVIRNRYVLFSYLLAML